MQAWPTRVRFFHEVDSELMESIIKVNIEGATWITKAVLPVMVKKKKGAIVNIGSGSSGDICSYPYTPFMLLPKRKFLCSCTLMG